MEEAAANMHTEVDLDQLERAALQASEGRWRWIDGMLYACKGNEHTALSVSAASREGWLLPKNSRFIEEAQPAVVLNLIAKVRALRAELNTPHTTNFLDAVRIEAAHQRERWGAAHDEGKAPEDWFWLLGWLAGKAVRAAMFGDREKALHHTISSAAVLLNWHAHMSGASSSMQPGLAADDPRRQA